MSTIYVVCGLLALLTTSLFVQAQQPSDPVAVNAAPEAKPYAVDWGDPASGPRKVVGVVQSCYRCHNVRDGANSDDLPPGFQDDGWVLLNELQIWANQDRKHYQAYAVLLNEQSQRIARLMGIVDPVTKSPAAHLDARCLACHSAVPVGQFQWHKSENAAALLGVDTTTDKRFNLGVSCEGCHGPSGSNGKGRRGWGNAHWMNDDEGGDNLPAAPGDDEVDYSSTNPQWRTWDPQVKFDKYGFWNVRSPVTQAKVCLSCHLGNVEQGKIITHSMYAAGHPPLPSFELTAFITQEPRHWRYLSEKSPEIREAYCNAQGYGCDDNELRATRATLISALIASGESAKLAADLIDPAAHTPADKLEKPEWPELANFACFACHHDLERDGWRQMRTRTGVPGRPLLHEWPLTMAEIAASVVNAESEFKNLQAELDQAVLSRPFGKSSDVLAASRKFADATEGWANQLAAEPLSVEQGRALLTKIATIGAETPLDYDAARQLIWAYASITAEIQAVSEAPKEEAEPQTPADALADDIAPKKLPTIEPGWMKQKKLSAAEEILKQLGDSLVLDLREGDSTSTQAFKGERRPRPKTEVDLNRTLPKIANYNPAVVQSAFRELLALTKE